MPKRPTDTEIAARIVPTILRWPEPGTTIGWGKLHESVDALRGLVKTVDGHCIEAEENRDLSQQGITRRRTELGRQALTELANFKPFQIAEKAALQNIEYLENKMVDLPQPPTSIADVALAQEIRQYMRSRTSSIDFAAKSISDHRVLGAILNAPPYLSGLSEAEFDLVRQRARTALHPRQTEMHQWLNKALAEVREGMAATKRMLLERCEMREDSDGQFSATREPLPLRAALPRN